MRKTHIISLAVMSALAISLTAFLPNRTDLLPKATANTSPVAKAIDAPQLLKDASIETSAISLWKHNDSKTVSWWLFEQEEEKQIVNYLQGINLGDSVSVDTSKLKGKMYGVEIGRRDGTFTAFTWIDGYVFLEDGTAYKADIDFDMIEKYAWQDENEMSLASFPNMYYIAKQNGVWNKDFLERSKKLKPHGLTLKVKKLDGTTLKVKLKNKTKKTLNYGEYFSIQTKIDDIWYEIPAKESMAFIDIATMIKAGAKVDKTYDLSAYGELPSGKYRIVVEGTASTFNIK